MEALGGWLVTRYDLALQVMRDAVTFTVDDPRFSTARVIGRSMLSTDGAEHSRHREPFVAPLRPGAVRERFAAVVAEEANSLIDRVRAQRGAELRGSYAGPLAGAAVTRALGLPRGEAAAVRALYAAIVAAVTEITAGHDAPAAGVEAFEELRARLASAMKPAAAAGPGTLDQDELISNAAVLLFGGIETTEASIANAILHLLERPDLLRAVGEQPALLDLALDESLRLEPPAAVVDRYATADAQLGGIGIARGDLVRISIAGANRDPAVFPLPDVLDLTKTNPRRHLTFAHGPHVCLGVHLARLELRIAVDTLLTRLPTLGLDPRGAPPKISGLVFRKPATLRVVWS